MALRTLSIRLSASTWIALASAACAPWALGCGGSSDLGSGADQDSAVDETTSDSATTDSGVRTDSSADGGGGDTGATDSTADGAKPDSASGDSSSSDTAIDSSVDTGSIDSGTSDSSSVDSGSVDSGAIDTGSVDTGDLDTGLGVDGGALDTGTAGDTGPTCPPSTACTTSAGAQGICQADGVTCGCTDVTDDPTCTALYGSSSAPFLCTGGACVAGNCRVDTDCAAVAGKPTCGFSSPSFCGGCAADADCATKTGTPICDVTSGACVAATCVPAATGKSAACPSNPADVCCGVGVGTCASGNCCFDSDCSGIGSSCQRPGGATSGAGVCTACAAPTADTFYVDPVGGNDATGVGSGATGGGCAFKTVTRALAVIGATPPTGTQVVVIGGASAVSLDASEVYPITVTGGVTITATGSVVVPIPAGKVGFALDAPSSGLSNLTLDGGGHGSAQGIHVTTGSSMSTTTLANVTVAHTGREGILVDKTGGVAIGAGVVVTDSGSTTTRAAGLHVTNSGSAVIQVPAGSSATTFNANSQHGILVDAAGTISITGAPSGTAGDGTVQANSNFVAGLWISQAAVVGGAPAPNSIDGLVTFGNGSATSGANGIHLVTPSNVKLRNSVSLGNHGNGIVITGSGPAAARNDDISLIDLGKDAAADPGKNLFQSSSASPNFGSGICLAIDAVATGGAPQTLAAEGNLFGAIDCSGAGGALVRSRNCSLGSDISSNNTTNAIDVAVCTAP